MVGGGGRSSTHSAHTMLQSARHTLSARHNGRIAPRVPPSTHDSVPVTPWLNIWLQPFDLVEDAAVGREVGYNRYTCGYSRYTWSKARLLDERLVTTVTPVVTAATPGRRRGCWTRGGSAPRT